MMRDGFNLARKAPKGASRPLWVEVVKSLDRIGRSARRASKWALRRKAAKLLRGIMETYGDRIANCGYAAFGDEVALVGSAASGRAAFTGLQSCNSVWACPVCSERISTTRRAELDALLAGARKAKLAPCLLTLTFRHKRADNLDAILDGLKAAWLLFQQRQEWRLLPWPVRPDKDGKLARRVSTVTALEATHSHRNSWHPHQHSLVLLDATPAEAERLLAALRPVWLKCLAAVGLDGDHHALQVQGASGAGDYIAKFGAAEELALGHVKQGRNGGRSPWQLLEAARDGDEYAESLWLLFVANFKGRRQLVWSKGLKDFFDIREVSDADAPDPELSEPLPVLRVWSRENWRAVRDRRCALLDAACDGTSLDAAESGPTDEERWESMQPGPLIE